MKNEKELKEKEISNPVGHSAGIIGSASNYEENVILSAERGHGFAAEKANHLYDKATGKDAKIIGGDNAKNGADRLVDGIKIQTKYCSTGAKCVGEAFDNGTYRYMDGGKPMQLEVPSDKYVDAVKAMQDRIAKGQVPGVDDPNMAETIVRKGHFTYEQARNIAKFGTVESITYDAVNGVVLAGTAMGLSTLISFAVGMWQGKTKTEALDAACFNGICVGGVTWISSILTAQIGRTSAESSLRVGTDWAVKQISPHVRDFLANAFRDGNNIYGAAATNHLSKLLRGNIASTIVISSLLSIDDFIALFSREISGQQAFKNICKTVSGAAGGSAGMWAGGAVGTAILPGIGTAVGAIGGAVLGGMGASTIAAKGLNSVIQDDSVEIGDLINRIFSSLAYDHLLNKDESDSALKYFKTLDMENIVKSIYSADDPADHARKIILPFIEREVYNRPPVFLPTKKKIKASLEKIIEGLEAEPALLNA